MHDGQTLQTISRRQLHEWRGGTCRAAALPLVEAIRTAAHAVIEPPHRRRYVLSVARRASMSRRQMDEWSGGTHSTAGI